uniref:tubulin polymerization-promoting protein family member 3-like n=1 Tax=Pristiophorus japonicus TaxID=55135 RepID=UPI00398ED3E9
MAGTSVDMGALHETFKRFAMHGDTASTGNEMTGKNWSKICKDCKVIDGKTVTSTDVDILFSKVKSKSARVINFEEFKMALAELAPKKFKGMNQTEALDSMYALIAGRDPTNAGTTVATKGGGVERLTDTSKYTGSHKERFDESGKGKGMSGREDISVNTGYVGNYKGAGTYDKTKGS